MIKIPCILTLFHEKILNSMLFLFTDLFLEKPNTQEKTTFLFIKTGQYFFKDDAKTMLPPLDITQSASFSEVFICAVCAFIFKSHCSFKEYQALLRKQFLPDEFSENVIKYG